MQRTFKLVVFSPIIFLVRMIPQHWIENVIRLLVLARISRDDPKNSLTLLLRLDNDIYKMTGATAVRYGNGQHVKHRLTGYIDHFANKAVEYDGPYLDVGCNTGEMSSRIAIATNAQVTGIDINQSRIEEARKKHDIENLRFVVGDATKEILPGKFGTIILSNVLEHIVERAAFLERLKELYCPAQLLLRVPNFERDWRVPLKKELGVDYFLDSTHEIEHNPAELLKEVEMSGSRILELECRWGEIWALIR